MCVTPAVSIQGSVLGSEITRREPRQFVTTIKHGLWVFVGPAYCMWALFSCRLRVPQKKVIGPDAPFLTRLHCLHSLDQGCRSRPLRHLLLCVISILPLRTVASTHSCTEARNKWAHKIRTYMKIRSPDDGKYSQNMQILYFIADELVGNRGKRPTRADSSYSSHLILSSGSPSSMTSSPPNICPNNPGTSFRTPSMPSSPARRSTTCKSNRAVNGSREQRK